MMLNRHRMPVLIVKPSSALRTDYRAFSKLCHDTDEPIIVTNNGESDLVVMSHEAFCRREAWVRLQAKLMAADKQIDEGKLTDHEDVFGRLRERVNEQA